MSAEFGRSGGAVINVTIKSGSKAIVEEKTRIIDLDLTASDAQA